MRLTYFREILSKRTKENLIIDHATASNPIPVLMFILGFVANFILFFLLEN
jgi:hypothetical protein